MENEEFETDLIDQELPEIPNQEGNWHKSEAEIEEDGHVW